MIGSTSISRGRRSRRRGCHLCLIASATSSKINLAFFPASGLSIQTHMAGLTLSAISGYMIISRWLPRLFLSRLLPSPSMRFGMKQIDDVIILKNHVLGAVIGADVYPCHHHSNLRNVLANPQPIFLLEATQWYGTFQIKPYPPKQKILVSTFRWTQPKTLCLAWCSSIHVSNVLWAHGPRGF